MGDGQKVNGQAKAILAVNAIFSFLAILCVVLRFMAKRYKKMAYTIDDWLIVIALVRSHLRQCRSIAENCTRW